MTAQDIKSLSREELLAWLNEAGQPAYRADQVLRWLYRAAASSWDSMTNLPRDLRASLAGRFTLNTLQLVKGQGARDTTRKFLWRLPDGALIESVLIPANLDDQGEPGARHTLCISTQVGCAYGCKFCASGLDGWKRDLKPEEIVEQVLATERWQAAQPDPTPPAPGDSNRFVNNVVVMGMGEPLANYANLMKALHLLNAPWGAGIGARRITISTSGLAPRIRQLADEPPQYRLAVSLHGATDEVRARLMPVNRKYPLAELGAACEYYVQRKGKMITLEYILIAGVNDSLDQVAPLAALSRRLHAKVNLIPYNQVEGLRWERPTDAVCDAFLQGLEKRQVTATLRHEKGHDIDAACGQLRLREERAAASSGSAC